MFLGEKKKKPSSQGAGRLGEVKPSMKLNFGLTDMKPSVRKKKVVTRLKKKNVGFFLFFFFFFVFVFVFFSFLFFSFLSSPLLLSGFVVRRGL